MQSTDDAQIIFVIYGSFILWNGLQKENTVSIVLELNGAQYCACVAHTGFILKILIGSFAICSVGFDSSEERR